MSAVRSAMVIAMVAIFLTTGCEPKTRYQVLSFFFDGVPDPEVVAAREKARESASGEGQKTAEGEKPHPSTHGPYGARMCSACHDPFTNQLLERKTQLCLKCHTFPPVRREHGPFAAGDCLACHDPHRASNPFLLVGSAKDFCLNCHDAKEVFSRKAHQGNKNVSCTVCHTPHGSNSDFFLK